MATSLGRRNFASSAAVSRSSAAAGEAATVTLKFAKSTGIDVGSYITVKNGQIGKKTATNPSIAGEFEVTSVSSDGKTITYSQYAPATSSISAISAKKNTQIPTGIVVSWYEKVGADATSKWETIATPSTTTYTDDGDDLERSVEGPGVSGKYRYQYRIRAVASDVATGIGLNGPWTYVPAGFLNTSSQAGWIYITDNLILSGVLEPTEANL